MRLVWSASVAVLALAAGAASAQDAAPNPEFSGWAKFKKGTSVTVKTTTIGGGATSETLSTSTLVEVGADKLVIEYVSVTNVNGTELKLPTSRREIPKTVPQPKGAKNGDPPAKPVPTETGTETLKIIGLELKTTWSKNKVEAAGTTSESKVWMSDEVPGAMVKMESTVTGVVTSTIKTELVEIKKP